MADTIKSLAIQIHNTAKEKGWWDNKDSKNIGELLMLVVSELSEALEADRKNKKTNRQPPVFTPEVTSLKTYYHYLKNLEDDNQFKKEFEISIKNTFEDEISDTVIRLLDLSEGLDIDLESHIKLKMKYNSLRDYKHGGKKY